MTKKLNITVFVVLTLLLGYLTQNFIVKESNNYLSLNYEWSNLRVLNSFGDVVLDSVSDNFLSIKLINKIKFNPINTYRLESEDDTFYFRYIYSLVNNDKLYFKGLVWLNKEPNLNNLTYNFSEIDLPIKKVKGINIVTIGDELMYMNEAKYFRKEIKRREQVNFLGDKKDIYGFNFIGNKIITYKDLNTSFKSIPKAHYFVIMMNPRKPNDIAFKNLNDLVLNINSKYLKSKIIIITAPVYKETPVSVINFNKKIIRLSIENNKVTSIDLKAIETETPNFYRDNINEISKKGYEKLAREVIKLF